MNGIYIHIPFCLKKCDYCDFASFANSYDLAESYVDAVIREMSEYKGEKADTVYIGGGTPTSLPLDLLLKLIYNIYQNFNIKNNAEFTVECNPKTGGLDYFKALKSNGVNRLSIGIQSLSDNELKFLGRIHSKTDAISSITSAKNAGFNNINVDLMFGLICQTQESVLSGLNEIISLSPSHLSCYSLIVEENTPFGMRMLNGEELQMDEETDRLLYKEIVRVLKLNGYEHYEISNFAKPQFESQHNIKYWERQPYIGLGAAAHSFFEDKRFSNPDKIDDYINFIQKKLPRQKETISFNDAVSEFMFLGLRMIKGVSFYKFKKLFGKDLNEFYKNEVSSLISLGLLDETDGYLHLTPRGIDVSNEVFSRFLL